MRCAPRRNDAPGDRADADRAGAVEHMRASASWVGCRPLAGAEVKAGDVIATMGSMGRPMGPHVHFEVWKDGKPVDPERVEGLKLPEPR
jgi:hypothetical protein